MAAGGRLDGRAFHDSAAQRDRDLERDLDLVTTDERTTVRTGWGQVVRDACLTASRLALLLQRRGWAGRSVPCRGCGWPVGL